MASNTAVNGLNDLLDLASEREKRDRAFAVAYVRKGETRGAVTEIVAEIKDQTSISYRTVYRAIERHLEWARDHVENDNPDARSAA